jgi:2,3-bisphosphoglycerate-independent phosphoglycerate mutase
MSQDSHVPAPARTPIRPVVLCVLDGWGHREIRENNAIRMARTPVLDRLYETCPNALIDASEQEVGLPPSQMGNSEVGHMNLGAGRIVTQDLPRIDAAVASGELAEKQALARFIARLKESGGTAHILGLLSPGGVHSHQDHMAALARLVRAAGVPVAVHGFLDGRDTPPRSARDHLRAFQAKAAPEAPGPPGAPFATITGRYYAMDRDQRWERNALAYRVLVEGAGETAPDAAAAIEQGYAADTGDEFVKPTALGGYAGMKDGDGLLMANFRADRPRQILAALLDPGFDGFARGRVVRFAAALGMVSYSPALDPLLDTLFEPLELSHTLGEVVAEAGLKQLRIAETEKYAHVTFFLNGGREAEFPGEERVLVPSPRVATYDLKPEMSAFEVTDKLVAAIAGGRFDLIVVNYANGDMVGHTGDLNAAIAAVEAVDACLGRLVDAVTAAGGALLITADHGNAEQMTDPETGQAHTAHTMNRVPAILVNAPSWAAALDDGRLADVAPTLFALLDLPKPAQMTGRSLILAAREAREAVPAAHAVAE